MGTPVVTLPSRAAAQCACTRPHVDRANGLGGRGVAQLGGAALLPAPAAARIRCSGRSVERPTRVCYAMMTGPHMHVLLYSSSVMNWPMEHPKEMPAKAARRPRRNLGTAAIVHQ